jgi:tetratricopeptide (TPR) repeat protein
LDKGGSRSPKKVNLPDRANSATSRDSEPKIKSNQGGSGNTQNNTFNYDQIVEDAKQEENLESTQTGLENVDVVRDTEINISQKIHRKLRKLTEKIGIVANKTIIRNLHLDSKNTSIALSFGFVVIILLSVSEYIRSKETKMTQQDKAQEVYLRAKDKLLKNNFNGGIQDLTTVIQLDPKYIPVYIDRGLARRQKKDHEGAIQDFEKAIRLDKYNFGAYNNICGEYRLLSQKTKQGRADTLNKAIKYCNDAISFSNSKVANPFFNRGVIFAMLGDRERAISDFEYAKQIALGIQNDSDLYNSAEKEIEKIKSIEKEKQKVKESKTTKCLQDSSDSSCTDPPIYDPDPDPQVYKGASQLCAGYKCL